MREAGSPSAVAGQGRELGREQYPGDTSGTTNQQVKTSMGRRVCGHRKIVEFLIFLSVSEKGGPSHAALMNKAAWWDTGFNGSREPERWLDRGVGWIPSFIHSLVGPIGAKCTTKQAGSQKATKTTKLYEKHKIVMGGVMEKNAHYKV
jgi:hypothetical protein